MKKTLVIGLLFLVIGLFIGNYLYNKAKEQLEPTFNEQTSYYVLQEGVYTSRKIMEENIKDIDNKVVDFTNNKYYVYVGITKDKDIANKIKNIYEKEGYQIYTKEMDITNEEFYNNVKQFDLLIKNASSNEEILTIEEVVLANYEEIIQKQ